MTHATDCPRSLRMLAIRLLEDFFTITVRLVFILSLVMLNKSSRGKDGQRNDRSGGNVILRMI